MVVILSANAAFSVNDSDDSRQFDHTCVALHEIDPNAGKPYGDRHARYAAACAEIGKPLSRPQVDAGSQQHGVQPRTVSVGGRLQCEKRVVEKTVLRRGIVRHG